MNSTSLYIVIGMASQSSG